MMSPRWRHFMRGTTRSKAHAALAWRPPSPRRFFENNGYRPRDRKFERGGLALTQPTVAVSRIGKAPPQRPLQTSYSAMGTLTGPNVVQLGLSVDNTRLPVAHSNQHVPSFVASHFMATADVGSLSSAVPPPAQPRPKTAPQPQLGQTQRSNVLPPLNATREPPWRARAPAAAAPMMTATWKSSTMSLRETRSLARPQTAGPG